MSDTRIVGECEVIEGDPVWVDNKGWCRTFAAGKKTWWLVSGDLRHEMTDEEMKRWGVSAL